jgi:phosphoglucosamine mutase
MQIRFGTDGLRGKANTELTPELALALGSASAMVLGQPDWFVGWDTRISSTMLASAFAAGVASTGRGITQLGEMPSAGVAYVCRGRSLPGAMVTASHNPYHDNGIKIFGADGRKISDDLEHGIEDVLARLLAGSSAAPRPPVTGRLAYPEPEIQGTYEGWLRRNAEAVDASRLRIGVDCANGAAYRVAPIVLAATGATVAVMGDHPDGTNINRGCGSTHLDPLAQLVMDQGLDLGLAFDGDADRVLAIAGDGQIVDGDEIIAILARHRAATGALPGNGVVVTEWSNLGLLQSLRGDGFQVEVCAVGDKAVAETIKRTGYVLGGEQSGHIIMDDLFPIGDGLLTAIELLGAVAAAALPLGQLAAGAMRKLPQGMRNVAVAVPPARVVSALEDEKRAINDELGDRGRLVLRASGTEPVVRVMVEADDEALVSDIVTRVADMVAKHGGTTPDPL